MVGERARVLVTELVEERRRAFDVGEKERDCARGQSVHSGMIERGPEKV